MKLAEALLLRKQLQNKVEQLKPLKQIGDNGVFQQQVQRRNVSENVDELTITTPRITLKDITQTYDHYAAELRKIDAAIQQANWAYDVKYKETVAPDQAVTEVTKRTK